MVIRKGLEALCVSKQYIDYIMAMLAKRKADINVSLERGVPQGDPLSQLLFIVAIDPLIRQLARKYGEKNIVAYCDDIIIARKGPGPT